MNIELFNKEFVQTEKDFFEMYNKRNILSDKILRAFVDGKRHIYSYYNNSIKSGEVTYKDIRKDILIYNTKYQRLPSYEQEQKSFYNGCVAGLAFILGLLERGDLQ